MQLTTVILILGLVGLSAFYLGRSRAIRVGGMTGATRNLHSLPEYYGYFAALATTIPALAILLAWEIAETRIVLAFVTASLPDDVRNLPAGELELFLNTVRTSAPGEYALSADPVVADAVARYSSLTKSSQWLMAGVVASFALLGLSIALRTIRPALRARERVERVIEWSLFIASGIAVLATVGIVASVLSEAMRFFEQVSVADFLLGTSWSPQSAIREDQVGSSGSFGILPLLAGTSLITVIAMLVAVPIGVFSAVYMAEYASTRLRTIVRPLLEMLAGIPTVVYGFFAVLTVAPLVRSAGNAIGLDVAAESALAAGLVMGIMIVPLISSLADDSIRAVPGSIREGALALGATRSETMMNVVLPAAMPGIAGGILLAVSRAIGETMIVVMAAGLAANVTANPFEAVTTVTVQIVTLLVGDQEFDSARTLAAFALGLVLFLLTMLLNVVGLTFVRRYRERYE